MRKVWVRVVSHLIALLLSACAFAQGARLGGSDSSAPGPWKQLAKLTEAKGHNQDWLGWSVAISKDGKTVVVGAVNWCVHFGQRVWTGSDFCLCETNERLGGYYRDGVVESLRRTAGRVSG